MSRFKPLTPHQRGGRAAYKKVIEKYGEEFYSYIGKRGGKKKGKKGFGSDKIGKDGMTGIERSRYYSRTRGSIK